MKRDLAAAAEIEETIQVPAALHFNLVDRLLELTGSEPIAFQPGTVITPTSIRLDTLPAIGEAFAGGVFAGVTLHQGERLALVLLAGERAEVGWEDAKQWAAEAGGELPSRIDALVLFDSAEKLGFEKAWYWTSAPYASVPSYAWVQYFINGSQFCYHTSIKNRARAVRRVPIR